MWKKTGFTYVALLLFTVGNLLASDKYTVIKVVGNIVVKNSGLALKQGDVLNTSETIIFKSVGAKASVINESKGRFILSGDANIKEALLKNNLLPAMSNISSRAGPVNNIVDLKNYFSGSQVILDAANIYISKAAFPMNDSNFFFIRYNYKNESIDKKIGFRGDTLSINKTQLCTIDNHLIPIPDEMEAELFYYSAKKPLLVSKFRLALPDETQVNGELRTLLDGMQSKTKTEQLNEVYSYLNEFYGKPDSESVRLWLMNNLSFAK